MKKIILGAALLASIWISTGNGNVAHANEEYGEADTGLIVSTHDLSEVDDLLSNDKVEEVVYLDPNLLENDYVPDNNVEISPMAFITKYRVRNVKAASDKTDSGAIATVSGGPGLQLSISQTKSVSTSLSGTFGASKGAISAEVGWNVTGSTSISISGSYKVPSTVNGKKVKSCKLNAHVVRKRKSFVVDKMAWNSTKWETQGTGYVSKAYGISFKKVFTYK